MDIPPPVVPIEFLQQAVNILLLGTDRRPSWKYYQTDAMVVLSLDPERIQYFRIDYTMVEDWRIPEKNYAVLLPRRELIRWMLEGAFSDQ